MYISYIAPSPCEPASALELSLVVHQWALLPIAGFLFCSPTGWNLQFPLWSLEPKKGRITHPSLYHKALHFLCLIIMAATEQLNVHTCWRAISSCCSLSSVFCSTDSHEWSRVSSLALRLLASSRALDSKSSLPALLTVCTVLAWASTSFFSTCKVRKDASNNSVRT